MSIAFEPPLVLEALPLLLPALLLLLLLPHALSATTDPTTRQPLITLSRNLIASLLVLIQPVAVRVVATPDLSNPAGAKSASGVTRPNEMSTPCDRCGNLALSVRRSDSGGSLATRPTHRSPSRMRAGP